MPKPARRTKPPRVPERQLDARAAVRSDDLAGAPRFEDEALAILTDLSTSFRHLLDALPETISRPRHLQTALGIDYTLAWRTFKVASAEDPLAAGADVPRPAPMQRLLDAAAKHKVKPSAIARVRRAYDGFEVFVRRHAGEASKQGRGGGKEIGGRTVFDALIGGVHADGLAHKDLEQRRATFKGNSHIWGLQAATIQRCTIYRISDDRRTTDAISIIGYARVHTLRRDVPMRLSIKTGVNQLANWAVTEAPIATTEDWHVLREFGSQPPPKFSLIPEETGMRGVWVEFPDVGRGAASDFFVAGTTRGIELDQNDLGYSTGTLITVPAEALVTDMLVARGHSDPSTVRVSTHGELTILENLINQVPRFELPSKEHTEHLGTDIDALAAPEVPRYPEMARQIIQQAGWSDTTFDIYRCRVRYPILHTVINLDVDGL